ncbi:hypothetical protein M9458_050267 [Cirrhinus mrigala]|uniref:Retrotransposon gag domain-containing protein n=1 Tax=Cirrhinus mrigala TaxID=683832 RepID=A0ABD0MWN9_CIRMR
MIQNAAAQLVFNEPKRAHITPLFITLHWLPIAACIKFNTLMLAYRTATGSSPAYLHSLLPIYTPSRTLRSASERRLIVPSQRGTKSLSRTFSYTVPGWTNRLMYSPPVTLTHDLTVAAPSAASLRYRILRYPKIQRLLDTDQTMDPASRLFCLRQGNRPIEDYVVDFCKLCHLVNFNDVALKDIFRQYIDYALLLAGSSFTVGIADEGPRNPAVTPTPQPAHVITSKPETFHTPTFMSGIVTIMTEPPQTKPAKPKPAQVTPTKPRFADVTSAKPQPVHVTSAAPKPAHVTSAHVSPDCESTPETLFDHELTPEASSVHKSAPEASPVHESAPEASPVHKSTPEASSVNESAPMPPEVAAPAAEPPKGVAFPHRLSACPVTAMKAIYNFPATPAQESAPMPLEVSAQAVDPPMGAASYHELSACHATAKEMVREHTALLWMSLVPLWISLLLSALPALPALLCLPRHGFLLSLPRHGFLLSLPRHGGRLYLLHHGSRLLRVKHGGLLPATAP